MAQQDLSALKGAIQRRMASKNKRPGRMQSPGNFANKVKPIVANGPRGQITENGPGPLANSIKPIKMRLPGSFPSAPTDNMPVVKQRPAGPIKMQQPGTLQSNPSAAQKRLMRKV